VLAETSWKLADLDGGAEPAARPITVANSPRVMLRPGSNVVGIDPVTMPVAAAQRRAPA